MPLNGLENLDYFTTSFLSLLSFAIRRHIPCTNDSRKSKILLE